MKSIIQRHITVAGHKTTISLERVFWESLLEIAKQRNETLDGLVNKINADRQLPNLPSAIRVFILHYYRNRGGPGEGSA
jgi:predicted DNA-binding ribbon-helix-helix protein